VGAPVLLVLNGAHRAPEELRTTVELLRHELTAQHATLFAVVANRCRSGDLEADAKAVAVDGVPGYAIPDEPLLTAPTVAELLTACEGRLVSGDPELLHRETGGWWWPG
jgi:phosphate acetyltransferase